MEPDGTKLRDQDIETILPATGNVARARAAQDDPDMRDADVDETDKDDADTDTTDADTDTTDSDSDQADNA